MISNFKLHNIKDLNIDLDNRFFGKRIFIDKSSCDTIDHLTLSRYFTINRVDMKSLYEKNYKMLKVLNLDSSDHYSDFVPEKIRSQHVLEFKNLIQENSISSYYFDVLSKRYELTKEIKDSTYDHSSSITGRMKITGGVNYLTLKKEKRKDIDIGKNRVLWEIDVKSCEPALLHSILYKETPDDIYSLFGNDIPRNKIKIAVISSIYGSSLERVRKLTGMPREKIKEIHDHFQLKKIKKEIISEFEEHGVFYNLYGRPIFDISSPVNYWLQSSAADFCCLAFLNLIQRTNFKLIACIHDAIILDIKTSDTQALSKVNCIYDPISNIKLRVEHTKIK